MSAPTFDISVVLDAFKKTGEQDGRLLIDEYIRGYRELTLFFDMLGKVFHFVNTDILEKIEILSHYRQSPEKDHFETIQGMFEFEIENDLTNRKTEPPSASRTLLRLHRALAFIMEFMEKLSKCSKDDSSSTLASEAYNNTLAQYHPWILRKGVGLAMYTLPSCSDLLVQVCGEKHTEEECHQILRGIVDAIRSVYDETEGLYTKHDLHGLP